MHSVASTTGAWMAALALLAACDGNRTTARTDGNDTGAGEKINAATPLSTSAPDTPAGDAEADNPGTGLNTRRPDSPKDLQPEPR
jgi:hypothetical protein